MPITDTPITLENLRHLEVRERFRDDWRLNPDLYWPFLRPCTVKLLLVADDGLDFSEGDFGLSTFVRSLLDMPGRHARFEITLAHIDNVAGSRLMSGESRIAQRIPSFKFDNGTHFGTGMYDAVFLFGIDPAYGGSRGADYPADRLSDTELRALTQFMNAGGGVFATGDHGSLGRALCHAIPRVRGMRLWQSTPGVGGADEVSMSGSRRNDTNRPPGTSSFADQSDDVPQTIQPRMYARRNGLFRYTYPHPLLCGPRGAIRVMPDHPHEGECVEPSATGANLNFGGALGAEYPAATDGGPRPLPELISTNSVLGGTRSGGKDPTQSQTFGGICAYDGHRAGIGRVVTDATWHHFVNVNLIGLFNDGGLPPGHVWRNGFLSSASGQAHFEEIKAYYRNLAVWLSRPERIRCMNSRLYWTLLWDERVMEAVLTTTDIPLAKLDLGAIRLIGQHARDVLGRFAGRCQGVRLALDLVYERLPRLIPEIDPWWPEPDPLREKFDGVEWLDGSQLFDIAIGSALVALREAFPSPDEKSVRKLEGDQIEKVLREGANAGLQRALDSMVASAELLASVPKAVAAQKPTRKR